MITASERLVRMPAKICGSAAGKTIRRMRSCGGMRYERAVSISVGSIAAHAVDRVQQHREDAEEGDERDLLAVADRVQRG